VLFFVEAFSVDFEYVPREIKLGGNQMRENPIDRPLM
jgi:hypothetical protein